MPMKVAISGKGGVGKTTLCALLAREAAARGYPVLAIDADPDANLATLLGMGPPIPLAELGELIEERVGKPADFFRLNPKVDDLPERFSAERDGVRLMAMGTIRGGGMGCACPENTFLKSFLQHALFEREEFILLDMEAGIEHLGRATAQGVDALVVVVDPDKNSLDTAQRVADLACDLDIAALYALGNRVQGQEDLTYLKEHLPAGLVWLGALPYSPALRAASRRGRLAQDPQVEAALREAFDRLLRKTAP